MYFRADIKQYLLEIFKICWGAIDRTLPYQVPGTNDSLEVAFILFFLIILLVLLSGWDNSLPVRDNALGKYSGSVLKYSLQTHETGYSNANEGGRPLSGGEKSADGIDGPVQRPDDEIFFDGLVYNGVSQYYQYCLKRLGYTDSSGNPIDTDGYFGNNSKSALRKFLSDYGYNYFGTAASQMLIGLAERPDTSSHETGFSSGKELSPFAFAYGNITDLHNMNDPFYSIKVLKDLPNVICKEPGKMSFTEKRVADAIKTNTRLFGYVNLGPNNPKDIRSNWVPADLNEVRAEIDNIANNGWYGVFIDQFGFDYGETRKRQNEIVDYAHSRGLKCIANAWRPEEAMGDGAHPEGNPDGIPSLLGNGDYYLVESFLSSSSYYRGDINYIDKYLYARQFQDELGVNIIALTYKRDGYTWDEASGDIQMSYILAMCIGYKGWWFGQDASDFYHGTEPDIDIGYIIQPLQHVSENIYAAYTDKYIIEYYAGARPYMVLTEFSGTGYLSY